MMRNYEMEDGSWDMDREHADYEMRELEAAGNRLAALEKKGICTHGSCQERSADNVKYNADLAPLKVGEVLCTAGCGKVFANHDEWHRAHLAFLEE